MPAAEVKRCNRCHQTKPAANFYAKHGRPEGWCKECYRDWHRRRYTPKVPVSEHAVCAVCGKDYTPRQRRPTKFCSTYCKNQARILAEKARRADRLAQKRCEWCAGPMTDVRRADAKFCGVACQRQARHARLVPGERAAYRFLKKYGITLDQRNAMLKKQGGCAICKTADPGPRGWALDHDHACCPDMRTDADTCGQCVRGVLCGRCNLAIGLLDDDPARLRAAAAYLKRRSK